MGSCDSTGECQDFGAAATGLQRCDALLRRPEDHHGNQTGFPDVVMNGMMSIRGKVSFILKIPSETEAAEHQRQ